MRTWDALRIVASREIRERFRSRSFAVSTLIGATVLAAVIVIPTLNDKPPSYDVGLVGKTDPVIRSAVGNLGRAIGGKVEVADGLDLDDARAKVRTGEFDLVLVDGKSIIIDDPLDRNQISGRFRLVAVVSEAARLQTALTEAGLTSDEAAKALLRPPLPIEAMGKPQPAATDQITTLFGVFAIFFFFLQYGSWILVGVAEEKSSRIAEVLLAAVRPHQLVGGKILGIGVVGLAQALAMALAAIIASRAVGSSILSGTEAFTALAAVGWFVLGFGFFGWAYGAAGSLVSRQSDAQAAAIPVSLPLYIGYFASQFAVTSSEPSLLVRVLAYLPPTAPLCMPTLIANDAVAPWQVGVSVALLIATSFVMARVAGAVYANSILRSGKRIKWLEALRAA